MNDNIRNAIRSFSRKKVLVIGDVMLDHYVKGTVSRISPEAPVPILKKTSEEYVPGGAANVAANLVALGASVVIAGVAGNDYSFQILKGLFKKRGIDYSSIIIVEGKPTITKEKVVARDQHMIRIDTEEISFLEPGSEKKFLKMIVPQIEKCDGIIFSDYAKGCLSKKLTQEVIKAAKKLKKPTFADVKPKNKDFFKGVDVVTPNLSEAIEMTGQENVYKAGRALSDFYKTHVVITKSERGITIFRKNGRYIDVPTKTVTVLDVSGAGDTYIATQTLGLLSDLSLEEAGIVANAAATIVVQKPGTATLNQEELESAVDESSHIETVGIIPKVWGYEKWLENNANYCCKLLFLNKGYQCSLHFHKEKDEMFFVTKGHVRLETDGKITHLRAGNFRRIFPGTKHRFTGIEESLIIEVSTYHDEADSYRLEESKRVDEEYARKRTAREKRSNGHLKTLRRSQVL